MQKKRIFGGFLLIILIVSISNSSIRNFFIDSSVFIKKFLSKPTTIGAIIPSSPFLASSITKYVKAGKKPIKVLEVGAGTGSITSKLIKKIGKHDLLDVIELDENFCALLNQKFKTNKNININCISILDWHPAYKYDYIISGLPFNAFDVNFIKKVLDQYKKLIKPGGMISYFEYIALAKIKLFFLNGMEKDQFSKTLTTTTNFRKEFELENNKIFANMPPAYVYHLFFK